MNTIYKHPGQILKRITELVYFAEHRNAAGKLLNDTVNNINLKTFVENSS